MRTIKIEFGITPQAFGSFEEAVSAHREGAKEIEAEINHRTMIGFGCAYDWAAMEFDNGKVLSISAGDGRVDCALIPDIRDVDEGPSDEIELVTPKRTRVKWSVPSILNGSVGSSLKFSIGTQYVTFFSPACRTEHLFDVFVARQNNAQRFLYLSES